MRLSSGSKENKKKTACQFSEIKTSGGYDKQLQNENAAIFRNFYILEEPRGSNNQHIPVEH